MMEKNTLEEQENYLLALPADQYARIFKSFEEASTDPANEKLFSAFFHEVYDSGLIFVFPWTQWEEVVM